MKEKNYVFLLLISIVAILTQAAENIESGYIFTSPRSLHIGSDNELQFLRFGSFDEGHVKVSLFYTPYNSNETLASENDYKLENGEKYSYFNLFVEPFDSDNIYNGRIQIEGSIGGKAFNGSDKVQFSRPKNRLLIIQTDKPMYLPGQTVQFRVLKLNKEFKPFVDDKEVGEVYVEDAKGTRLFQFKNLDLNQGMQQMEFPLSDDPVKGTWKITFSNGKDKEFTSFDVKEYVLPKFEVKIKFPPYVLATTEIIPIEICAKYTYGKPVVGKLHLNVSEEKYTWSREKVPTLEETIKLDGCHNYTLNVTVIKLPNSFRRRIQVVARVIEDGTDVEMNETEYLQREYSPLNLNFNTDSNQREYYKPGLPYNGKLQVTHPDSSVAPGEDIEICNTITRQRIISGYYGTRKVKICRNFTSDENGYIKYTIPPQNVDSTSMQIQAKSLKYARNSRNKGPNDNILSQPDATQYLTPFYSPSGSFAQLQGVSKSLSCDDQRNVRLLFTSKDSQDFKFHYEIIKQGKVVFAGKKEVSFSKEQDDISGDLNNNEDVVAGPETPIIPPATSSSNSDSDSDCPSAREIKYVPPVGEVQIPIDVGTNLSPSFTLLVFYVRDDRETVADSQKFEVEKCFKNDVGFEFGDEVKQPGTKTSIKVTASPNSLCGVKIVDKSVSLLDSSNQLTKEKVFQLLQNMDSNIYYSSDPCNNNAPQPGLYSSDVKIIRPPNPYSTSTYKDSFASFQNVGLIVISNLILFTRPCENYGSSSYDSSPVYDMESFAAPGNIRPIAAPMRGGFPGAAANSARRPAMPESSRIGYGAAGTKSAVEVRDYFPETWLFEMQLVGPDGSFVTKEKLPHTITEWVGSAVCVSQEDGLGMSNSTSIRGFQAFFISYTLPASVVRGEEFWLVVSIFNYAEGALPITVTLDQPDGFDVTSEAIDGEICVEPERSQNLRVKLKATKVGSVNITVRAETAASPDVCGDKTVADAVARDAITKPLTVEAEGFPVEKVTNYLFCPTDSEDQSYSESVNLSLPEDTVPDSARSVVDVTGNVMGPAIQNLNRLVSLPTGCGEQNMVKFTPNYLVLDYLSKIGQLDERTKRTAIKNLNTGYQRELTYRHPDGSFSAFGEVDKEGSMFLTAFVLRSFHEAKRYIDIDAAVLARAQNFIVSKQQAGGCFPDVGRIIDSRLGGGLEREKSTGSITAYVVTSLMLSEYENDTVIQQAMSCLAESKPERPYENFLYAYAEAMSGDLDAAKARIEQMKPLAEVADGTEYYRNLNGTKALNLETVAYAVLANLKVGATAGDVLPLIRFMTQNMNPRGGFHSTQDTCVGLDGLSKFAALVYKDPVDILVELGGALDDKVDISEDNKLLVQRSLFSSVLSELSIRATGSGCGLIQAAIRYNTNSPPEKNKFYLEVVGNCIDDACKKKKITTIVSYIPEGKMSGMSVVQIKMITGTVPVKESLQQLISDKKNKILRFDVENNEVMIYFSEISNVAQQFAFEVEEVVEVENAQPGQSKVFDYYDPDVTTSTSYSLPSAAEV